jgi:hypothetical protein
MVGNLYENSYSELVAKYPLMSERLQKDPNSICHICNVSEKYWVRKVMQKKNEILGGKTIMQLLNV